MVKYQHKPTLKNDPKREKSCLETLQHFKVMGFFTGKPLWNAIYMLTDAIYNYKVEEVLDLCILSSCEDGGKEEDENAAS